MDVQQQYRMTPIGKIKPHPDNPRKGKHASLEIETSIAENGWYGAIIVQKSTGHILAGEGRYEAAQVHGAEKVPVITIDVDDEAAKRILLGDNRIPELSGIDQAKVDELLGSLESLEGTGYEELASEPSSKKASAKDGEEGAVPADKVDSQYGVIVMCDSEPEQEETYNILKDIVDPKRLRVVAI